ncbi:enoyl-CoA hydratase [Magnetospirillum fulvum]|uniref:Enoyl-CoA hydratase/carnithine racemase n=1 Tax=Magnetospirillum fulvum TaxID=1082 RepID=A0A1H6H5N0_MAGFU|nr:enoyl-CoA hydratase [Magnetospirillum fulvum]SEH31031.1 Enoyl-CoA hydratase/carnithine racemase [Magnetospirillum fulvum]
MTGVSIRHDGATLILGFDRPDKRNAITVAMYGELAAALEAAEADPAVRVVLFQGHGGFFTAGNDLRDFLDNPPEGPDHPAFRFIRALASASKVLVAAIEGPAIGVGATMLLHCDVVIAARGAQIAFPFINLGLVPEAGSSLLLPRLVGYHRAAAMLMLGDPIDAETAREIGLVARVVDSEDLLPEALALAARLAAKAPEALRQVKALLKSPRETVDDRIVAEADVFIGRLRSPELREAVDAFFAKRPPDFSRFA